jgi:predicted transposase YbfD/YdcC
VDISIHRHGDREERRTLEVSHEVVPHLDWPHLQQVCRMHREVEFVSGKRCGETTSVYQYALTSQPPELSSAAQLQGIWRGHWGIENRLHWVRDVTMGEDLCQVRLKNAPKNLAALRNTTLNLLRLHSFSNIAETCRHFSWHPEQALALLGIFLA